MTDKLNMQFQVYPQLTQPEGPLPRDKRAQACWFFYLMAQGTKELVGDSIDDQILLEEDLWMDTRYEQQARTTALVYGLESPDEFAKFWPYVTEAAKQLGLPTPHRSYTALAPRRWIQ